MAQCIHTAQPNARHSWRKVGCHDNDYSPVCESSPSFLPLTFLGIKTSGNLKRYDHSFPCVECPHVEHINDRDSPLSLLPHLPTFLSPKGYQAQETLSQKWTKNSKHEKIFHLLRVLIPQKQHPHWSLGILCMTHFIAFFCIYFPLQCTVLILFSFSLLYIYTFLVLPQALQLTSYIYNNLQGLNTNLASIVYKNFAPIQLYPSLYTVVIRKYIFIHGVPISIGL